MTIYDVFLSHASTDKPSVETLARRLREDGFEPFLDKWHLVPGEPWQEALEDALEASRTCAVFVGEKLGPWQNEEMRVALDERARDPDFRVIPILLPGALLPGKRDLPRFLRRLTWVDFRNGLNDEDAYHQFVSGIRGVAPGVSAAISVPVREAVAVSDPARHDRWWRRAQDHPVLGLATTVSVILSAILVANNGLHGRFENLFTAETPSPVPVVDETYSSPITPVDPEPPVSPSPPPPASGFECQLSADHPRCTLGNTGLRSYATFYEGPLRSKVELSGTSSGTLSKTVLAGGSDTFDIENRRGETYLLDLAHRASPSTVEITVVESKP